MAHHAIDLQVRKFVRAIKAGLTANETSSVKTHMIIDLD
jgi:hypothetical protein